MSKHTPGPWTIDKRIYIQASDGLDVAVAVRHRDFPFEANARLIAAAPELLEALERLLKWVEPIAGDNQDSKAEAEELASVEAARSAISKAKGTA